MTLSNLKTLVHELASLYFSEATVIFAKQSFAVKQKKPLVVLTFLSAERPQNPSMKMVDGRPVAFYSVSIPVQIDLFTRGKEKEIGSGMTVATEDTAEDDLLSFCDFLNSQFAIQWCHRHDIALLVPSAVQNMTDLINDTNYEFRAMVEVTAKFTMEAIGYTGILAPESVKDSEGNPEKDVQAPDAHIDPSISISPSGGGNKALLEEEYDYFENIRLNDKLVKEDKEE